MHQLKPQHAAVKPERAIEIGDLEMDMPDAGAGDDGREVFGHALSPFVFLNLAALAGRGRILRVAKNPGEGDYPRVLIWGESPSPQPSQSELCSSCPREERGEGDVSAKNESRELFHASSGTYPSGSSNSNVLRVIRTMVY